MTQLSRQMNIAAPAPYKYTQIKTTVLLQTTFV